MRRVRERKGERKKKKNLSCKIRICFIRKKSGNDVCVPSCSSSTEGCISFLYIYLYIYIYIYFIFIFLFFFLFFFFFFFFYELVNIFICFVCF